MRLIVPFVTSLSLSLSLSLFFPVLIPRPATVNRNVRAFSRSVRSAFLLECVMASG